jgi:hypothetical protein
VTDAIAPVAQPWQTGEIRPRADSGTAATSGYRGGEVTALTTLIPAMGTDSGVEPVNRLTELSARLYVALRTP